MDSKLMVKIFDTNLTWLGLIEEVSSLILRTSFNGIETSELKIKRRVQGVELITVGSILVFNNQCDRACIVEDVESSLEDDTWTFTLLPLKAIMNYRIIENLGHSWTNQPQAKVMSELVNFQTVVVSNTKRRFSNLIMGTINTFGDNVSYVEDWRPLGEKLTELSMVSDMYLGWNVVINSTYTNFVFETYQGTDKSDSVVFSEEYGNLKNATYTNSTKDFKNYVYVGDSHVQVGDGVASGFSRRELTIDSSQDETNLSSQQAEGKSELNERQLRDTFDAEILDNQFTMSTYRTHWNLGDKVKIQSDVLGVQTSKQITVLEEIYFDNSYSMNVTFGEGAVTLNDAIKSAIRSGNGRKITSISGTIDWTNVSNKPSTFPPSAHTHVIADVTNLQTTLNGKANTSHTHAISDVTNLQTTLDSKAPINAPSFTGNVTANSIPLYQTTPSFTNLTLQNGATVNNSRTPKYIKIGNVVYLEGEITAIANTTVVATLPVGYRPASYSLNFACAHATATPNNPVIFSVNISGQIQVISGNGTNGYCLNNIVFVAEQ